MLGVAYACSIGGITTLVGTPPNLSFVRIFEITFPDAEPIAFGQWMLFALPLSIILLLVVWWMLTGVSPGSATMAPQRTAASCTYR